MIEINFQLNDFGDISQLRESWLSKEIRNNVMYFDERVGKGMSFFKELEPGLHMDAWDYILKEDTRIVLNTASVNDPIIYNVNFLLTTDSYLIEINDASTGREKKINILNNLVLHSNRTDPFSYIVKKGQQARALDIYFSHEWLLNQFPTKRKADITRILTDRESQEPIYFEPISKTENAAVSEVIDKIFNDECDIIFLKSRVMVLMNRVIGSLLSQRKRERDSMFTDNVPVMIKVERKLRSILNDKMPVLKTIADEFSMSESTLKRQFKQDFGVAVYEYYLRKKMELARRMIEEENKSISQVAYSLGYEKAGSFIKAFKKQYGISPGGMRTAIR